MAAPSLAFRLLAGGVFLLLAPSPGFAARPAMGIGNRNFFPPARLQTAELDITVSFLNPRGHTVTFSTGTTFMVNSWSDTIPLVYPREYWGTFPLYFVGDTVPVLVTIKDTEDHGKPPLKVRIEGVSNILGTDGSLGEVIGMPMQWVVVDLRPGQSRTLAGSIVIPMDPNLPSGLDRTRVSVYKLQGNSKKNLLLQTDAIWCPPALAIEPKTASAGSR